jgi:hypothetical protein
MLKDDQHCFAVQPGNLLNQDEYLGSEWHPYYNGQKKIEAHLLNPVATILNWDDVYEEIHPVEKKEHIHFHDIFFKPNHGITL